ncbi:protein tramtrack: beta isoform-like isoform X2 [Leptotrombidium deliense]|uniref:Protein tramtrack: beta isoform-like isoform X2 n=1 Tax=Leptotrombidium deliense TaxID=299467 RepID=A0A443SW05_9ACAR|nr:protein tramtrack: beta isoform-like isoform X2 [Leptotrombidium deliense]
MIRYCFLKVNIRISLGNQMTPVHMVVAELGLSDIGDECQDEYLAVENPDDCQNSTKAGTKDRKAILDAKIKAQDPEISLERNINPRSEAWKIFNKILWRNKYTGYVCCMGCNRVLKQESSTTGMRRHQLICTGNKFSAPVAKPEEIEIPIEIEIQREPKEPSKVEFRNQLVHREVIVSTFHSMFKNQQNCDVSLIVEGRMIKAHKFILSIFSTFFKDIFEQKEGNSSVTSNGVNVAFLNYKFEHVEALVEYMYTGYIRIKKDEWAAVVKCAQDLGITAIVDYNRNIDLNMNVENKRKSEDQRKDGNSKETETKRSKNEYVTEIVAPTVQGMLSKEKNVESFTQSSNETDFISDISLNDFVGREKDGSSLVIEKPNSNSNTGLTTTQKASIDVETNAKFQTSKKLIPAPVLSPIVKIERSDENIQENNFENRLPLQEIHDTTMTLIEEHDFSGKSEDFISINTCIKCGLNYSSTHMRESDLPTPPTKCPVSGCDKIMKMNRMLIDHLTKYHRFTFCEET